MHGRDFSSLPPLRRFSRRWFVRCAFAAAVLAVGPGCSRKFFRQRADKEVEGVLTQKNVYPDWQVKNWNVYPDPRARFASSSPGATICGPPSASPWLGFPPVSSPPSSSDPSRSTC